MQVLVKYLFNTFVCKSEQNSKIYEFCDKLLEENAVSLLKESKSIGDTYELISLLLIKNVVRFSPTTYEIRLSLPNVMVHQRLSKLRNFAEEYLDKNAAQFVRMYFQKTVQNGLGVPVKFNKKKIQLLYNLTGEQSKQEQLPTQNGKKKGKTQAEKQKQQNLKTENYSYHRLIYEYKQSTLKKTELFQTVEQKLTDLHNKQKSSLQNKKNSKGKGKTRNSLHQNAEEAQDKIQSINENQTQNQLYMLNIEQLTNLIRNSLLYEIFQSSQIKQKGQQQLLSQVKKLNKLLQFQKKLEDEKEIISNNIKFQKIQEFISQIYGSECLLIFNILRKCPFANEKELIKQSMMGVLQTRKSLDQLVQAGFVYFYQESVKNIVYKIADLKVIEKKYLDLVCKSILNFYLFTQKLSQDKLLNGKLIKQKLVKIEAEIHRLDNILLIFGF